MRIVTSDRAGALVMVADTVEFRIIGSEYPRWGIVTHIENSGALYARTLDGKSHLLLPAEIKLVVRS